jgi:hypothetical protein
VGRASVEKVSSQMVNVVADRFEDRICFPPLIGKVPAVGNGASRSGNLTFRRLMSTIVDVPHR